MRLIEDKAPLTRAQIDVILDSPIPYTKARAEREVEQCEDLMKTLNDEQVELAAQASFAYWLASLSTHKPTDEQKMRMAMRECRRHLFKVPFDNARAQIHDTAQFRRDYRVGLLRATFMTCIELESDEERATVTRMRANIVAEQAKQKSFVRGHDKDHLALLIVHSRQSVCDAEDDFILSQVYMMERALAVTETITMAREEKIVSVFDFGDFHASTAPSLAAAKRLASTLQGRYPERLRRLVVTDPPFWLRTTYKMVQPFLAAETRAKFIMSSGAAEKLRSFQELVDDDQAMPFMLPSGKLTDEVDTHRFLNDIPFNKGYSSPSI